MAAPINEPSVPEVVTCNFKQDDSQCLLLLYTTGVRISPRPLICFIVRRIKMWHFVDVKKCKFSTMTKGRTAIKVPDHPKANSTGYVLFHRVLMENYIQRYLRTNEDVHHINRIKTDNRVENLKIINHNKHAKLHNNLWSTRKIGTTRKLNYDLIKGLYVSGLGWKRISDKLKCRPYSVKNAIKRLEVIHGKLRLNRRDKMNKGL